MLGAFRQCVRLLLHFNQYPDDALTCGYFFHHIFPILSIHMNVKAITTFAATFAEARRSGAAVCFRILLYMLAFVSVCLALETFPHAMFGPLLCVYRARLLAHSRKKSAFRSQMPPETMHHACDCVTITSSNDENN